MTDPLLDRLVVAVGTHYLVEAEIGRGGMAVVYRATDLRLHRQVAIKVLPPELAFNPDVRERFLREAQTAAQLAHPGIVPIYTVDEREGIVYFVMALVEGESLGDRLQREGRLPVDETRRIAAGVADALAYAHARGVVHRDVKPDNIMLDRASGRIMVTDFGIARAAQGDTRLTVTGVAIGTPAYMSPEQAIGERELDGRSDQYSLGVIAYQMLAGVTPFVASNTPAMLVKHVSETPRPLALQRPDVPAGLAAAVARALAKKPEERWPDAAHFREALLDLREPAAAPPRVPADPSPARDWYDAPHRDMTPPRLDRHSRLDAPPRDIRFPADRAAEVPLTPERAMALFGTAHDTRDARRMRAKLRTERYSKDNDDPNVPVDERISRFRRNAIGSVGTIGTLAMVNLLFTHGHLWFIYPAAFISIGIVSRAGKLWSDGVPIGRIFSRGSLTSPSGTQVLSNPGAQFQTGEDLASAEVVSGPYGLTVRGASSDRRAARELLARLTPTERALIPDVAPTIDSLCERIGTLASTLHRLDGDVRGTSVEVIDARAATLRLEAGATPSAEQERRLALLQRQRSSIAELEERRHVLVSQLESAGLALQNLRLDLLKLRSSGLETGMSGVASATQEARAISRDIANAVDAVREANDL